MNKVFLSGNLTRDAEVRYTANGKAYARMGIAINSRSKDKEITDFFNLTAWDKTAEFCGRYLRKGSRVLVEGRLKTSSYENRDGVKVNTVDIWIDNIEFAGGKRDGEDGGNDYSDSDGGNSYSKSKNYSKSDGGGYSRNRETSSRGKSPYDFDNEPIDPEDTPF